MNSIERGRDRYVDGIAVTGLVNFLKTLTPRVEHTSGWPMQCTRAIQRYQPSLRLQLFTLHRLYDLVRMHRVVDLSIRGGKSPQYLFSKEAFLAYGTLCWGWSEFFDGMDVAGDSLGLLIERTRYALGASPLGGLIHTPNQSRSVPATTHETSTQKLITEVLLEEQGRRRPVWNKATIEKVLIDFPIGGKKVEHISIGVPVDTAHLLYVIDRKFNWDRNVGNLANGELTYDQLHQALKTCQAIFEQHPGLKTIVDVFFFIRNRSLRGQEPPDLAPDEEDQNKEPDEEELEDIERRLKNQVY